MPCDLATLMNQTSVLAVLTLITVGYCSLNLISVILTARLVHAHTYSFFGLVRVLLANGQMYVCPEHQTRYIDGADILTGYVNSLLAV